MYNDKMKAADYRRQAWYSLSGNWGWAILACLVATVLGGVQANSYGSFNVNINLPSSGNSGGEELGSTVPESALVVIALVFLAVLIVVLFLAFIYSIIMFGIGSIVEVGYSQFNLNLIDAKEIKFVQIFSFFRHWWKAILTNLLRQIVIFCWMLLFIIPGIIASYRYSMVPYILAENPDLSPTDAMALSHQMMKGNKWRFFCLKFSFFGWNILCALTAGILEIWIGPYRQAAYAASLPSAKSFDSSFTVIGTRLL